MNQQILDTNTDTRDQVAAFSNEANEVVSTLTQPLHYGHQNMLKPQESVSLPAPIMQNYDNPILKTPVTRTYLSKDTVNPRNLDPIHLKTVEMVRSKQRIALGPAGGWYAMGAISQHNLPSSLSPGVKSSITIISFRMKLEDPSVNKIFQEFRVNI
ncbi:hypothetical protein BP5796_01194 [Coleophoma crateriformis]|uniref:Uncharacterized protein n=1 Tax=Coleophoma crateriformis TaxID=565419 RepID=A0A3D8SZU2_9HELO|nr:hypothetical protein BP5796_01194 [Coleophoma crateriformis]